MKRITGIAAPSGAAHLCAVLFAAALTLSGCMTAPLASSSSNIDNPYVGVSELASGDYAVLGRVSGTGEVTFNKSTREFTGDTFKYGYLGALGNAGQLTTTYSKKFKFIPVTTTNVTTPSDCYGKAEGNACYELIQAARDKGADAVIFVMKSFENTNERKTITAKCTVTGVAIKLK